MPSINIEPIIHTLNCTKCTITCNVHRTQVYRFKKTGSYLCKECKKLHFLEVGKNTRFKKGDLPHNKNKGTSTKESKRLYKLKWKEKNRAHCNKYFRDYYNDHIIEGRIVRKLSRHKRRTIGNICKEDYNNLCNSTPNCKICSKFLDGVFEIDHIIPIKLGGTNDYNNLQLLCRECNRRKSSKSMEQYLSDREKIK